MQDEECVRAVLAGDRDRFGELIRRYQRPVQALALAYTHDAHAAEDLAQDVFVKAYSALAQLREPAQFGPWLLQIARHHSARDYRRRAARPTQPLQNEGDLPARSESERPSNAARVLSLIEELPEPYRETVRLKYQEDLTCREIAEREGVPVGTITCRLTRAVAFLRTALKENPQS
jgi:RNA polymerase sigma-70 factor (ECF subfamily)